MNFLTSIVRSRLRSQDYVLDGHQQFFSTNHAPFATTSLPSEHALMKLETHLFTCIKYTVHPFNTLEIDHFINLTTSFASSYHFFKPVYNSPEHFGNGIFIHVELSFLITPSTRKGKIKCKLLALLELKELPHRRGSLNRQRLQTRL